VRFANEVIRKRREEKSKVVAGVHEGRTHLSALFGPLFGDKSPSHGPFASNPDSGQHTASGDLPDVLPKSSQECEKRVAQDREHQRANTAESIGDWSPNDSHAPSDQEQSEQQPAVEANVAGGRRDTRSRQEFAKGGHHDQREYE
jgi:hypothetical protein